MFEWNDIYSLEIDIIDKQHKKLFEIGKNLTKLAEEKENPNRLDKILDLINELIDYSVYHFNTEEDLFEKYGYENAKVHKEIHEEFINYLKNIRFTEVLNDEDKFINEILKFIGVWILRHIKREDSQYKDFLISKINE